MNGRLNLQDISASSYVRSDYGIYLIDSTYSGQAIINQINNLPFDYNFMNLLSDTAYLT